MKKRLQSILIFFAFPFALIIRYIASRYPLGVEYIYSKIFYKVVKFLSVTTGLIPFSIGELTFYLFIFLISYKLLYMLKEIYLKPQNFITSFKFFFLNIIKYLSIIYFIFILIWGVNYYRLPFASLVNLETSPSSIEELESLCKELISNANELRENLEENNNGVMSIKGGYKSVFDRAHKGYEKVGKHLPVLKDKVGKPKPILLSNFLSYTGISGIYFPFTGEANINIAIPDVSLPSTTCHEIAHQHGFAREDEANYIAYLTSINHPDRDFQYSGTLLALTHSMKALYKYDKERYHTLRDRYSEGLNRDIEAINNYWKRHEGTIERASTKVNDIYLKSNQQRDGIYSYGRMVDLLLAEFKDRNSM